MSRITTLGCGVFILIVAFTPPARALDDNVKVTPLLYQTRVAGDIESVKENITTVLEGRNFAIVNVLNVQQGLKNRGIVTEPILLIEFINLGKAYQVTRSNRAFEVFAPLKIALFEERGQVTVLFMRPSYIKMALSADGLSAEASHVLDEFDRDISEIARLVAHGGF